ncbi:c-type cytochrome [Variovorax dokdonensis]|uniref:C-type cytochrome n=1 Tax=Variovorax dokdonensis TaxID=344883 RepID=A0ABT7ND06_9BURK|nr:c-type cytochrome [Variovorax dokdonensis]
MRGESALRWSGALGLLALAAALSGCSGETADAAKPANGAKPAAAGADQVARGLYLARAADCAACHTADGGAPMAGGVPLPSPFGMLYGTNITPDPEHGIGKWSADDFYKALHDGSAPGGRQLYPAMPYTSYRSMPREDADAIYAYLMQLPPVSVANKEPDLSFPYNLRFGVYFWKVLFLKDELPDASQGQSVQWQRGRYLANGLGHCAECHTPRGKLGQLDADRPLQGGLLGRVGAPDITPKGLAARGWTEADIATFMATGIAPQGTAFDEMHKVIDLSTQYLTESDNQALVRYLTGDRVLPAQPPAPDTSADRKLGPGRQMYLNVCAGCHGREGEGRASVAVAMSGNSTLRQTDARNLLVSILDGLPAQKFPGLERMQEMPGFASELSDAQVAELANYLRVRFGGQPADVSASAVAELRGGKKH